MPEGPGTVFYRVDPRLVHATLMSGWVPALGLERLVIACADVAADRRLATICRMSASNQVEVRCVKEHQVAATLAEAPGLRQMVLFASLAGVERAIVGGLVLDALNVGHLPRAAGTKMLVAAVHLAPDDRAAIDRLTQEGIRVYVQPLADDDPRDPLTDELSTSDLQIPSDLIEEEPELPPVVPAPEIQNEALDRVTGVLEVVNERGLHLRAASVLAQFAGRLSAHVEVGRGGDFVNAKSLLGLTTLGAGPGTMLDVVVTGPGARDAFEALRGLFARGFEEGAIRGASA